MNNNDLSDRNLPDFSQWEEMLRRTQEIIRTVTAAALRVQEVIKPIVEMAEKYK